MIVKQLTISTGQTILSRLLLSAGVLGLAACGGGGDGAATPTSAEPTVTPGVVALAGLSAQLLPDNQLQVVLSNTGSATAYCVRTDALTPAASDACFTSQRTQTVPTSNSTSATAVRAWTLTGQTVSAHQKLSTPGKTCSTAAYQASTASALPTVCVITDKGEMVIALEKTAAPNTVTNFLRYTNDGFYNNTCFHRITSLAGAGFSMVQGGGLTCSYQTKTPSYSAIAMEAPATTKLSNTAGTIAMARTSAVNSATSGFFINASDNSAIFDQASNPYAVFGSVVHGLSTLTTMAAVPVGNDGGGAITQPLTPLTLQWLYQIK